ncbi:hypothetical protein M436DRAFT_61016 [Aureobasidium namibiae CBS 147.97]|uniref:Uncharacterized protein n=1 Tax=Aureobasidium namibiae CBS 147.97 TaxID=1043004 RepID=A0A074WVM5_9PEZI|nr:uncharacterized protein M436DRAFT_61016 [Aureobasidium namibiae CBS 147.97]KEQ77255.1 hypothetical protein M436DRAFT_61016 [Aureobasidium namibiae CBS 147.97]
MQNSGACLSQSFLLYFHEWVVDTEKDEDLSITKAVLASHIHAATIEKITFVYKRKEVLDTLASLNRQLILVFDPFADFDDPGDEDDIDTQEVEYYFDMILVLIAVSKLAISSIHVRARREDWDKRHMPLDASYSLIEPHRTFTGIELGTILQYIHQILQIESRQGTATFPPLLVAKYPSIGDMSFDYLKGRLMMRNLHTFHWSEFRIWIFSLECKSLRIQRCNLNPSDLSRMLAGAIAKSHPIRHISIVDTVLHKKTAEDDKSSSSPRTSIHCLIQAILPYAHQLDYLRFTNIWAGVDVSPDSPVFEKNLGELEVKGREQIRPRLVHLSNEFPEPDAMRLDGNTTSGDE